MSTDTQAAAAEVDYPDDDGLPMADNTLQYRWIVTIQGGLDGLFGGDRDVFVAGNLLWYPVQGDNRTRLAPDVMVIFGRPKEDRRGSYRQWEEAGVAPQVVFEVLSPSNDAAEMAEKRRFYDRFGVEEYYEFDPDSLELRGWRRGPGGLAEVARMNGFTSPRLGIRFELGDDLTIFRPDGRPFTTFREEIRRNDELEQRAEELERQAEELEQRAEELEQRAELERTRAEESTRRAERLAEKLRALGIDPDE